MGLFTSKVNGRMSKKLKLACKMFAECIELMDWLIMVEQVMIMERPLYFDRQIYLRVINDDFRTLCLS